MTPPPNAIASRSISVIERLRSCAVGFATTSAPRSCVAERRRVERPRDREVVACLLRRFDESNASSSPLRPSSSSTSTVVAGSRGSRLEELRAAERRDVEDLVAADRALETRERHVAARRPAARRAARSRPTRTAARRPRARGCSSGRSGSRSATRPAPRARHRGGTAPAAGNAATRARGEPTRARRTAVRAPGSPCSRRPRP